MMTWKTTLMTGGLALALVSGTTKAQEVAKVLDRQSGDLPGPIDSLQDVQDTGRMLFSVADTNNDGQISQKEAIDAGNLMVGGFFFRADQNGDGVLSQEEAKAARESLYAQQPILRYVIEKAQYQAKQTGNTAAGTNPTAMVGDILDTNNDKQLQASEVRQAVGTGVQMLYAVADTNRDGQMTPTEVNAAIIGAARTAAQAVFNQADSDNNGSLSKDEFNKAITEPANMVFAIFDGNNDGQISKEESDKASQIIQSQLRGMMVPEPNNSARNLLRKGVMNSTTPAAAPATGAPR